MLCENKPFLCKLFSLIQQKIYILCTYIELYAHVIVTIELVLNVLEKLLPGLFNLMMMYV